MARVLGKCCLLSVILLEISLWEEKNPFSLKDTIIVSLHIVLAGRKDVFVFLALPATGTLSCF